MMKRTALVSLAAALLLSLALSGCSYGTGGTKGNTGGTPTTGGGSTGGQSGTSAVSIKDFSFNPATVTVKVGQSVTWTNEDSAAHTVTGSGSIESGSMAPGDTFTKTFDTAGTFEYKCSIHPYMNGKVVVE